MSRSLSLSREALVALSAALAARDPLALEEALALAAERAEGSEVEEVILQSYLFLGYPAALNAFALWRETTGRPADPPVEDAESWLKRGAAVCQAVYAGQYAGLRANVRRLHPDMERWMVEEGYGKVLGRSGLDLATRELCIAALLAVLDAPRQLYSHLRGALNVGVAATEVARALELAAAVSDEGAQAQAAETWAAIRQRNGQES
jgi:4-carboxymuconolactone decarboxylase